MNFLEFNSLTNPRDEAVYVANISGKLKKVYKFADIRKLALTEPLLEIGWLPTENYIGIRIREENILDVIKEKTKVLAYKNKKTGYIYIIAKADCKRGTSNNLLTCGCCADTFKGRKKESEILLPFRNNKVCVVPNDWEYILNEDTIEDLPIWLKPVYDISSSNLRKGVELPIPGSPQTTLSFMYKEMRTIPVIERREILKFINDELSLSPCTEDEMKHVLRLSEATVTSQFFDKETFMHNLLGDYLIENCHIVRDDTKSIDLYFYDTNAKIYSQEDSYILGYMTKLCPTLKHYQKEEALKYIKHSLYDERVNMNSNPFTIVFKNGVLDIKDMILRPMGPEHLESIRIDANYNPKAYSATVDTFFQTATSGAKDTEQLLYEAMGYAMLKTSELQQAFICTGSGRNGKSTYLDLLKAILGPNNHTAVSFKDLANNFRASQLKGKLASIAGDISSQPITDSDLVKSIIAGEDITIEQKYKDASSEALFATLFYACNKLPRTPDTSEGFFRRFTIIPFNADLSKVTKVAGMRFKADLLSQESLDYAAYKAVQAIKNVFDTTEEFTVPKEVLESKREYRIDNSAVLSFIKEEFGGDISKLQKLSASKAFSRYTVWAETAKRGTMSSTTFKNALKAEAGVALTD